MGAGKSNTFGASTTAVEAIRNINLTKNVVIVTGANTGIGLESARAFFLNGAHVVLASRNEQKGLAAVEAIQSSPVVQRKNEEEGEKIERGSVEFLQLDLSSLESVRKFSEAFLAKDLPLHILLNNAGVMALPNRETTADGFEQQIGVNHFGHYYLTKLLLPALRRGHEESGKVVRIVNVASDAHQMSSIYWDDILLEKSYNSWLAYGQSKTANILFTLGLHLRYHDQGIHSYAVHPGVIPTELGRNNTMASIFYSIGSLFMKTLEQGAATSVYCATAPEVLSPSTDDPRTPSAPDGSGRYYKNCNLGNPEKYITEENANRLWDLTEELLSQKVPGPSEEQP